MVWVLGRLSRCGFGARPFSPRPSRGTSATTAALTTGVHRTIMMQVEEAMGAQRYGATQVPVHYQGASAGPSSASPVPSSPPPGSYDSPNEQAYQGYRSGRHARGSSAPYANAVCMATGKHVDQLVTAVTGLCRRAGKQPERGWQPIATRTRPALGGISQALWRIQQPERRRQRGCIAKQVRLR